MNIILIGYMGAGKTSVGKQLAGKINIPFLDTDEEIEQSEGKKIADIFQAEGESYFRGLETSLLKKLMEQKKSMVIAVGGGLPLREENQVLLKELGTCVYLRVSKETILDRLKYDTKRPLLQSANREEKIEQMLSERIPIYEKVADYSITTDGKELEQIIEEIMQNHFIIISENRK